LGVFNATINYQYLAIRQDLNSRIFSRGGALGFWEIKLFGFQKIYKCSRFQRKAMEKMESFNLEERIKTKRTTFTLREFLIELNSNYPNGFISRECRKLMLKKWGSLLGLENLEEDYCGYFQYSFSQGRPTLFKRLVDFGFLKRELIRGSGSRGSLYKYRVVQDKLKEEIKDQSAPIGMRMPYERHLLFPYNSSFYNHLFRIVCANKGKYRSLNFDRGFKREDRGISFSTIFEWPNGILFHTEIGGDYNPKKIYGDESFIGIYGSELLESQEGKRVIQGIEGLIKKYHGKIESKKI